jgi:RNase P/RNase MRP subunit p30
MRAEIAEKYKDLKQIGNKEEFDEWFLNYKPDDINNKKIDNNIIYKPNKKTNNNKSNNKTKNKKSNNKTKNKKSKKTKKNKYIAIYGGKTRRNLK